MVLPELFPPQQSVFIPDKDIHNNILKAHEILTSFSKKHNKK